MGSLIGTIFCIGLLVIVVQSLEIIYIRNHKKPFFVFYNLFPKKLTEGEKQIIQAHFSFYNRLKPKYKNYFEHRVVKFVKQYEFVGQDIEVTDEMKLLIASSYVKLTFGFRDYLSKSFSKIVLYPDVYYSKQHNQHHKGEFNPRMKTVVFSWKHFKEGIEITNDNLNLGLHEFTHVIHIESRQKNNLKSVLFRENLHILFNFLENPVAKEKLVASGFLRDYAYENQFEFAAVILEHFFESPQEFRTLFPDIYTKVKQMINFNENRFIS